jgi:hypothetical protein
MGHTLLRNADRAYRRRPNNRVNVGCVATERARASQCHDQRAHGNGTPFPLWTTPEYWIDGRQHRPLRRRVLPLINRSAPAARKRRAPNETDRQNRVRSRAHMVKLHGDDAAVARLPICARVRVSTGRIQSWGLAHPRSATPSLCAKDSCLWNFR